LEGKKGIEKEKEHKKISGKYGVMKKRKENYF
jgi:hypothetical protein